MIIGGIFPLPDAPLPEPSAWPLPSQGVWTCNARSGLWLLLRDLQPERLWLPTYLCPELYRSLPAEIPLHFYPLLPGQPPADLSWTLGLHSEDLVLCPAYFGFPPEAVLEQALRDSPASVVVDAAQALFLPRIHSDWYYLYSPRKWAGLPDGGLLTGPSLPAKPDLREPPARTWLQGVQALILRREYQLSPGDNPSLRQRWFELYQQSEAAQPAGPFGISTLSRALLIHGLDYAQMRSQRCQNYRVLAARLEELALYPELPEGVVPLGFPIRLAERDRLRDRLASVGIFCPVHWPLPPVLGAEFKESQVLASQILTLPCDQRYSAAQMHSLSDILQKVLKDV